MYPFSSVKARENSANLENEKLLDNLYVCHHKFVLVDVS